MLNIVRKNIRMSDELARWYENKATELGVSQSNLMVMALAEYVKQEKTMIVMSNIQEIMEQAKELADTQGSQECHSVLCD